jgi:hypothetical protein
MERRMHRTTLIVAGAIALAGLNACSGGGGGSSAALPSIAAAGPGTLGNGPKSKGGTPTSSPSPSPAPSGSSSPTPAPTSTPRPTPAPTSTPTATPTATPTSTPTSTQVTSTNQCVYFRSNPMCSPLPATKAVASNSGAWASLLFQSGHDALQSIEVTNSTAYVNDVNDGSEPLYPLQAGTPAYTETIACNVVSWSAYVCGLTNQNGAVISVPANLVPASNSDHHASIADYLRGGEEDFWLFPTGGLTNNGTLNVGGAGFCSWSGDGTNCSGSTATNIATSLGGIDPADLKAAEASGGTLPYAISVSALCADPSYVYPATASDGSNTNSSSACSGHTGPGQRPPEGTRGFLNLTDAQVNATNNAPYVKVILRTMDAQHLGFTVTDTNWSGAPGLAPQYRKGDWTFAESEAGLPTSGVVSLPVTTNGINLSTQTVFCSNGTC